MNAALGERTTHDHARLLRHGSHLLAGADAELEHLLDAETRQQKDTLAMIASASVADPSVLAAAGSAIANVTAEGYPGARYHPGAHHFDAVERLAITRAKAAFGAHYANVQPHSCSSANLSVLAALVPAGGVLLGLDLDSGGHLTHGSAASVTGQHYRAVHYGLNDHGRIDYEEAANRAQQHRPRVIIAGSSAYPRTIDFARFRAIADAVGAYLLADISHIAGLVVAGAHPSPIDHAHVTTTSTYKQLGGPRGGLILIGRDHDTLGPDGRTSLAALMQRAVFPLSQGTPNPAAIAAKARALGHLMQPGFAVTARRIVDNAQALASALETLGHHVLTGGTDNHIVMLDLRARGLTGVAAERALEQCGILANRNRIPGDNRPPHIASGLRLGTNILAQRGMGAAEMTQSARLLDTVLRAAAHDRVPHPDTIEQVRAEVAYLCRRFPLPAYATGDETGAQR